MPIVQSNLTYSLTGITDIVWQQLKPLFTAKEEFYQLIFRLSILTSPALNL